MLQALADSGKDVPAIRNRPDIDGVQWLWEAYIELMSCRPPSDFQHTRIPWTAVEQYAEAYGFNEDEKYVLHGVVREMDFALVEYFEQQRKPVPKPRMRPKTRGSRR